MSTRTILVVFLALVCGAAMVVGVLQANRPKKVGVLDVTQIEPVLVAVADLARGKMVTAADVEVCQWPKGLAPANALRKTEDAVERAAVTQVFKGELMLESKLAVKGAGRGLAALVPSGMRALTVMASKVATNVAGFVLPGNKVDVLLNMRGGREDDSGGGSTMTLLQAVEVLAVDQRLEAPAENKVDPKGLSSVTLVVTPDQANLLDLGQNMGTLTLSLRNPTDKSDAYAETATLALMRSRGQPPPAETPPLDGDLPLATSVASAPAPVESPPVSIVTWRGGQRSRIWLTDGQGEP